MNEPATALRCTFGLRVRPGHSGRHRGRQRGRYRGSLWAGWLLSLLIGLLMGLQTVTSAARGETIDEVDHYRSDVWARVVFGVDGKAQSQQVVGEDQLPAAFVDIVKTHLAAARVEPRSIDGKPATFTSGVRLQYEITRSREGGSARLAQVQVAPLPLKRYYAAFPRELRGPNNWDGAFTATCLVGTEGVCSHISVKTLPGMPPSIHRYAKASLERWTFEPQRVDDVAVVGEYVLKLNMHTIATRPEDFRMNKFDRIQLRR